MQPKPIKFINANLPAPDDQALSALQVSLQVKLQTLHSTLESTSAALLAAIPSVHPNIELVRRSVHSLTSLKPQDKKDDVDPFARLRKLHLIKERMEHTRAILREAEKWSLLSSDLDTFISSNDYLSASSRIAEALLSISRLPLAAREDKIRLIETYQNRLESYVLTSIIMAIKEDNQTEIEKIYSILKNIQREEAFFDLYTPARITSLSFWKSLFISNLSDTAFLREFEAMSADLYAGVVKELDYASILPTEYPNTLLNGISANLSKELEPKLASLGLATLVGVYSSLSSFISSIEHLVDKDLTWKDPLLYIFKPFKSKFIELLKPSLFSSISDLDTKNPDLISTVKDKIPAFIRSLDTSYSQYTSFVSSNETRPILIVLTEFVEKIYSMLLAIPSFDVTSDEDLFNVQFREYLVSLESRYEAIQSFQSGLKSLKFSLTNLVNPTEKIQDRILSDMSMHISIPLSEIKSVYAANVEETVLKFSRVPSSYITRIGEGVLILPQVLEGFVKFGPILRSLLPEDEEDVLHSWILGVITRFFTRLASDLDKVSKDDNANDQISVDVEYIRNVISVLGVDLPSDLMLYIK